MQINEILASLEDEKNDLENLIEFHLSAIKYYQKVIEVYQDKLKLVCSDIEFQKQFEGLTMAESITAAKRIKDAD